jgi:hypothetical protein
MTYKKLVLLLIAVFTSILTVSAQQITGQIVDKDGYAIPYASVSYKGHHIAVSSDIEGKFSIEQHAGWVITISSVGFKSEIIKVTADTQDLGKIKLSESSRTLNEVVVKQKRGKYTRKNNPAVELMRRVIAAKKRTDLKNHDYYQYTKYQKLTTAMNDISEPTSTRVHRQAQVVARPGGNLPAHREAHPAAHRRRDRDAIYLS